jgi:hypothetical protein
MWGLLCSISFGYSGGDGSAVNPYQIANVNDLLELRTDYDNYSKNFNLTANIDLEGEIFYIALISPGWNPPRPLPVFSGTFDGSGHVISNFIINRSNNYGEVYLGLFGVVSGDIQNLGLESFQIISNIYPTVRVGGLVGYNMGTITHCYTKGIIEYFYTSSSEVGGLVGRNTGNIIDCYANTQVSGSQFVGGLVGENYNGSISYCYSSGFVSGSLYVGGLTGYNFNGSVDNSFWDKDTSGQISSAGGTIKTTAQMKTLSTFTLAEWDFTNETANGTNNIWRMCGDGVDYPRLNWESVDGDFACPDGVSVEDLDYFVGRWLLENCTSDNNYCGGADVDGSGVVDLGDYAIVAQHWLEI